MHKINNRDVQEEVRCSPQVKYQIFRKHVSLALGGKADIGTWSGGHPFDVELVRLPPGAKNFPLHQHSVQWEFYLILQGSGFVNNGVEKMAIEAGDTLIFRPEEPHQFINLDETDLVYYVIATNQPADVTFYPETGKYGIKPQRKVFAMQEVPYYEPGE